MVGVWDGHRWDGSHRFQCKMNSSHQNPTTYKIWSYSTKLPPPPVRTIFLRMMSDVFRCFRDVFRCSRDIFRCSRNVFRCSQLFSDVLRMPSIDHRYFIEIPRFVQDVLRCFQMITDVFGFSLDILYMSS